MLSVMILDDEKPAVEELAFIVGQHKDVEISGIFTESSKALEYIYTNPPDLLFLDIEMPGVNGIEVAKKINELAKNTFIVFVTAYSNYAIKAFEINAQDYILKPYEEQRVYAAIERISKLKNQTTTKKSKHHQLNKIAVWDGDHISLIPIINIIDITCENNKVLINTKTKTYHSKYTLNELEDKLANHSFFRCHRSYLVNLDKVKEIIPWFNNSYMLKMEDLIEDIPVSRRNANTLKNLLKL